MRRLVSKVGEEAGTALVTELKEFQLHTCVYLYICVVQSCLIQMQPEVRLAGPGALVTSLPA